MTPDVSVLLPFRDAEKTLSESMDSILGQTLGNFEILAVNDHAGDGSEDCIRACRDARIRLFNNPGRGLVAALNAGLQQANSNVIARMDADDIMYPQRLEKQLHYLQARPGLDLLASRVKKFPEQLIQAGYREYMRWQNACISPQTIGNEIYIESPFAHPSVMFRRDRVVQLGGYRAGRFPEDYELWLRMFHAGCGMKKLPEVLLGWRESADRLSRTAPEYARSAFDFIRAEYLAQDPRIRNRPIVYWGAGRKTRRRARLLIHKGYPPLRWIDIDARKIGRELEGVRVEAPAWLDRRDRPFVLNYVTNHGARAEVRGTLGTLGYRIGRDYLEVG